MEVQIKKLAENIDSNICYLPKDIFEALQLSKESLYKLHLGQREDYSYITPKEYSDRSMYFSNPVFDKLLLFENITLNIWKNGDEIYLGPVVGIFEHSRFIATIRNGQPSFCTQKLGEAANKTNCLSYYYTIEGVNWDEGKIKGYTFDQSLNKWRSDWFPMPDVVYDNGAYFNKVQKPLVRYMRRQFKVNKVHFINNIGYLDKWEIYHGLSKYPEARIYLPKTIFYRNFNDVLSLLDEFKYIFVKAIHGSSGKQVLSIEQIDKKYKLIFNQQGLKELIYKEIEDVKKFAQNFTSGRQCVVQQGIRLLKYNGRNFDLRMLMIKNRLGKWEATQHHCRVAQETYTITNSSLGSEWINYEDVYPHLSSAFCKGSIPDLEELINATEKVIYYFEKEFGAFGELGMDMAVDIYGNVRLIEANTRPSKLTSPGSYAPGEIPPAALNIFEYARFLAGNVIVDTK